MGNMPQANANASHAIIIIPQLHDRFENELRHSEVNLVE
jgi:hypothetical protein